MEEIRNNSIKFILSRGMNRSYNDNPILTETEELISGVDVNNIKDILIEIRRKFFTSDESFYRYISTQKIDKDELGNISLVGSGLFKIVCSDEEQKKILIDIITDDKIKELIKEDNKFAPTNKFEQSFIDELKNTDVKNIFRYFMLQYGAENVIYKSTLDDNTLKIILTDMVFTIENLHVTLTDVLGGKSNFFKGRAVCISDVSHKNISENYTSQILTFNYKGQSSLDFVCACFTYLNTLPRIGDNESTCIDKVSKNIFLQTVTSKERSIDDDVEDMQFLSNCLNSKIDAIKADLTGNTVNDLLNNMLIKIFKETLSFTQSFIDNSIAFSKNYIQTYMKYINDLGEALDFEVLYRLKESLNQKKQFYIINALILIILAESNTQKVIPRWYRALQISDIYDDYVDKFNYPLTSDIGNFLDCVIKSLGGMGFDAQKSKHTYALSKTLVAYIISVNDNDKIAASCESEILFYSELDEAAYNAQLFVNAIQDYRNLVGALPHKD